MATAPEIEIRGIDESEYEGWFIDHDVAFGRRATAEDAARARPSVEVDRALAAFDGEAIVGTTHALSVELTVPGGACPTALVDMVGVLPTHRRRGVLTRMMERQLSDIHERGEPLAALTASESVIYGRFGYGIVSMHEEWSIDKEHSELAARIEPQGRMRFVDGEDAKAPVLEVYLGVTSQRPGMVRYRPGSYETFLAGGGHGQAPGAVFRVVYEEDGRPLGYAKYRTGDDMLEVQELMGLTPSAWAALWGYCLGMDLTTGTTASRRPVDDPLLWMLADPVRLQRSVMDRMWLRIVDVGPALERRQYGAEGRLVLQVTDEFCPWNDGVYVLEGGESDASCRKTSLAPDLVLSVGDLAAAYLGATGFTTLARAGRVAERTPGALSVADAMFRAGLAPWAPYNL